MATYNSLTNRTETGPLIPEDAAREIIKDTTQQSVVLSTFRPARMSRKQQRMPALAAFPTAYFRDGDTGLAQTTAVEWENKYLNAEYLDCMVPIPNAVIEDADYDIWAEVRPLLAEAMGRTIDAAVFFGTNAPDAWPDDVKLGASSAANKYDYGTTSATSGGVAQDLNELMMTVEADGFTPNRHLAHRGFRGILRGARATDGQKLLDVSDTGDSVDGIPVSYGMDGLGDFAAASTSGNARLFTYDSSKFMAALRDDLMWKVLDQAVIQDGAGNIVFNLAQQDMVALKVTMRVAWQVANPLTHAQETEASRYPAAVLLTS